MRLTTASSTTRVVYWDNIKGLLIVLVVFAHCLFGLQNRHANNVLVDAIYYFHMPAFVFVSGYFSKSRSSRSTESLLKLAISYLIVMAIPIFRVVCKGEVPHLLSAYNSEWYLAALILWRMLVPLFEGRKAIVAVAVSAILAIVMGFWPDVGGNSAMSIKKAVTFLPFFVCGYLLPQERVEALRGQPLRRRYAQGAALLAVVVVGELLSHRYLGITDHDLLPNAYEHVGMTEPLARLCIFAVAAAFIAAALLMAPDRKLPFLCKAGRNSLTIYLFHRPFTLLFSKVLASSPTWVQLLLAVLCTIAMVLVLGSDAVSRAYARVLRGIMSVLTGFSAAKRRVLVAQKIAVYGFLVALLLGPVAVRFVRERKTEANTTKAADPIYRVMDAQQQTRYQNAYRLLFCGDLILLEDQVRNAYTGSGYDFSEAFAYTKEYISSADYAIGVLEGPLAGGDKGYSNSNYGDGKNLRVNFPDEWSDAVVDAGFDMVTLANNHIMDMGFEGKDRTLDVLQTKDLDYVGAYRGQEDKEKNRVKVVDVGGLRMAVLAYTYGLNGYSTDELLEGDVQNVSSYLVDPGHPAYVRVREAVAADFALAKEQDPDLILVLPHWGTQFSEEPDEFQESWQKTFAEYGADVILGDHTHSVQPVALDGADRVFTLYCPGNYANIYREHDGDFSAMVEVYVDKQSKEVIGGSVIPMWVCSSYTGNYAAMPVYDLFTNAELGSRVTTYDMDRVAQAQEHVTRVMLGQEVHTSLLQQRFYFDEDGFVRTKASPLSLDGVAVNEGVARALREAKGVCFVGDSVTEGTKNGGVPWYEPLEGLCGGSVCNCGWSSATTRILIDEHLDQIVGAEASLYVVAIGTNDVRYRNAKTCAMTPQEYVANLQTIRDAVLAGGKDAQFVFVAPWTSTDGDRVSKLGYEDKMQTNAEYTAALEEWCKGNGDLFANANVLIDDYLGKYPQSDYLVDYIHPNATKGVELYAKAFISCP